MAVTEAERHDLFAEAEEVRGPDRAATMTDTTWPPAPVGPAARAR